MGREHARDPPHAGRHVGHGDEFDLAVMDSPEELEAWVRARSRGARTARLTAGFCWPWSNPLPDGTLVDDVVVDDWAMPWNAKPESGRLQPGIPKSNFWATDRGGVEQVGLHLHGPGIRVRLRRRHLRPRSRLSARRRLGRSAVVFPRQRREAGAKTLEAFAALVKNAYRVLLTRGTPRLCRLLRGRAHARLRLVSSRD